MRFRAFVAAVLVTAVAALVPPRSVAAQRPAKDTTRSATKDTVHTTPAGPLTGAAEVGYRGFVQTLTPQQRGKFVEYKDVPAGVVVPALFLQYDRGDTLPTFSLSAANVGQLDQSLHLRAKQAGLFDARLEWDRLLHTFSTDGRSLYTQASPGVYTLPTPRPDSNAFLHAPYLSPIRSMWDPVKLSVGVTPSQQWDFKADFTRIEKRGDRPMGQAYVGASGPSSEILEPIDQTVSDVRLTESYATTRFQLMGTYNLSVFQNYITSVTASNPQAVVDAAAAAANGRTALAPNNLAHTVTVTGGVNLPMDTRVTASGMYSWWHQNDAFLPATINSAIVNPLLSTLPPSLGAHAGTSMVNGTVYSRPLRALNVSARFNRYGFRDDADYTHMPIMITNDRSVGGADSASRDPFTRTTADLSATWRVLSPVALSVGYGWNRMERDSLVRNVVRTTETTPHASLDFTGVSWLSLRTTYTKGWRRDNGYHQMDATEDSLFRRFDEANRDRERTSVMAQVTPIDQLSFSASWEVGHDAYPNSVLGVQSDNSAMAGGDVEWTPNAQFTMNAGYTRETYFDHMQGQYRTGSSTLLYNPSYIYVGDNQDVSTTASVGFTAVLVPDQWEAGGTFEASKSHFLMGAYNPQTPTGGTAAQNTAATAVNFPVVTQNLQPMNVFVRYHFAPDWAVTMRYQGELYSQSNYETATLVPATGKFFFLANNFQNYNARYFTFSFSYRPGLLRLGRSTL